MLDLPILFRNSKLSDLEELQQLFVDTISTVCKADYSPAQIKAWTSSIENKQRWLEKLTSQYFLIAELEGKIVGYISLEDNVYIDLLYVHKDYQRQGIADRLYAEIENDVKTRNVTLLKADVSITAKPFFEHKGFKILSTNANLLQDIEITNYTMGKRFVNE